MQSALILQVYNMHNQRLEMLDRNYQLIQQVATVLPADELIVRMVHKLHLVDYLK